MLLRNPAIYVLLNKKVMGEDMLDTNTTTVITSLITVGGTLAGVVLGIVLSNHYVSRQEKARRAITAIEEVYTLLMLINDRSRDNIAHERYLSTGIRDEIAKVNTLTKLYLPSLMNHIEILFMHFYELANTIALVKQPPTDDDKKKISTAKEFYNIFLNSTYEALEKLLK